MERDIARLEYCRTARKPDYFVYEGIYACREKDSHAKHFITIPARELLNFRVEAGGNETRRRQMTNHNPKGIKKKKARRSTVTEEQKGEHTETNMSQAVISCIPT